MNVTVLIDPAINAGQRKVVRVAGLGVLLRRAATQLNLPRASELTVKLTTDETLENLNARYRDEKHPTDVLAFPAADEEYIGDIAISVERAIEQAPGLPEHELRMLAVHGFLHCLGYDHLEVADAREMTQLTKTLLPDQDVLALVPTPPHTNRNP